MSFRNAFQDIQRTILNYTRNGKPYEIIAAIMAAREFNTIISESDLGSNGKQRQLKINYYAPDCVDDSTCDADLCTPGEIQEISQAFFNITRCTSSKKKTLRMDDIKLVDGEYTFSDHARAQILSGLPTVRGKLANEIAALLVANIGLNPVTGQEEEIIPFMDNSTGGINPTGLWDIERTYRDAGWADPFIVGGRNTYNWMKAVAIGGLNESGLNVARMGRTNAYYDGIINTTIADPTHDHAIAFDPQLLKFVTFSDNVGMFATELNRIEDIDRMFQSGPTDYIHGAIADPLTGLIWDLNIIYDKCTKTWTWQYQLKWDIFFMPARECNIQGANGITRWDSCLPEPVECPTPSPVSPSASTFTYSAAGLTFPFYLNKLELGLVTNYPNVTVANTTELRAAFQETLPTYVFGGSGTNITYTGYSAIGGQMNDTTNITFS